MDRNGHPTGQAAFCRKCGSPLIDGSLYCSNCGAEIVSGEFVDPQDAVGSSPLSPTSSGTEPAYITDDLSERPRQAALTHSPKGKVKLVLFTCLGIALLAAIAFGITRFIPVKIERQPIDGINGCPEFFDVEFGMTVEQVYERIDLASKAVFKSESGFDGQAYIFVTEDANYSLYGLPVQNVYCGFDGSKLDCVIMTFSKDKTETGDVLSLYEKIYGQTSSTGSWIGSKTLIKVTDDKEILDTDQEINAFYMPSPNSRYPMLSFDGSEIDPCRFLSDNYIFDKQASYYIDGLEEGDDYTRSELSVPGFAEVSQYTLYPVFEYMGIASDLTSIEFSVEADHKYINLVSYKFLLDANNVFDRVSYIGKRLIESYGNYDDCYYMSMSYSDWETEEISFETFCDRAKAGTPGNYNVQWVSGDQRITLTLTIRAKETYYEGSVSFSS